MGGGRGRDSPGTYYPIIHPSAGGKSVYFIRLAAGPPQEAPAKAKCPTPEIICRNFSLFSTQPENGTLLYLPHECCGCVQKISHFYLPLF